MRRWLAAILAGVTVANGSSTNGPEPKLEGLTEGLTPEGLTPAPSGSPSASPTPAPSFDWRSRRRTRAPTSEFSKTIELRYGTCGGRDPLSSVCPGGITGPGVPCAYGQMAEAAAKCHDWCAWELGVEPAGVHIMTHYSTYNPGRCHCCCATTCDCFTDDSFWKFASFAAGPAAPVCPAPSPAPTSPVPRHCPYDGLVPVDGGGWGDWLYRGNPKKGCSWVAKRPVRRCKKKSRDGQAARASCCACARCVDRPWTLAGDASKGCAWVNKNRRGRQRRCDMTDEDGVAARARCCACGK